MRGPVNASNRGRWWRSSGCGSIGWACPWYVGEWPPDHPAVVPYFASRPNSGSAPPRVLVAEVRKPAALIPLWGAVLGNERLHSGIRKAAQTARLAPDQFEEVLHEIFLVATTPSKNDQLESLIEDGEGVPRIVHFLLPIPGKGGSDWGYAWVPVVGPLIGGALAAAVFFYAFTGSIVLAIPH